MAAPQIPADVVALMARGISVIAASCDASSRPSIMRAVGSLVEDEAKPGSLRITIFVSRRQSAQLVQDVSANGHIAVVFSEPATHRTVQVKATKARVRNAAATDEPALARYLASMEIEIARVGYGPHMTRAMLAHRLEDLVAISFAPEQAFDQTPGPKAGASLDEGRA
ncbi:pyridoxamine 5'-phosphate oxidase family protein [Caenimonas sp. SL110]|uniref:pyridoxamine 5'-phosphate oxidase family protein n=1 Tax=Caenimonas sp. SL110 TaxID=1450524 RepID=UPI000653E243|nr:pyridoxamine 5'-phosphate oxidase family protein [Caenimonas sp. SL110]